MTGSSDRASDDSVVLVGLVNSQSGDEGSAQGAFRVRNDGAGNAVIVDIQFEGIWLAITDRADYTSFLGRNGGNLAALV